MDTAVVSSLPLACRPPQSKTSQRPTQHNPSDPSLIGLRLGEIILMEGGATRASARIKEARQINGQSLTDCCCLLTSITHARTRSTTPAGAGAQQKDHSQDTTTSSHGINQRQQQTRSTDSGRLRPPLPHPPGPAAGPSANCDDDVMTGSDILETHTHTHTHTIWPPPSQPFTTSTSTPPPPPP
jgi:hypothetical protein